MAKNGKSEVTGWVGWVYFAGILMLVQSLFQAMIGFVALARSDLFVVTSSNILFFNYDVWGWVHLVLALVLLTAGLSVINGGLWGRTIGVLLAIFALFTNLAFLPAYPVWAVIAIVFDVVILYALIVHGKEARL